MPGQQRRGRDGEDFGPAPAGEEWCQRGEPHPVGRLAPYPAELDEIRQRQRATSERLIGTYRTVLEHLDPERQVADGQAPGEGAARAVAAVEEAGGFAAQLADIEEVSAFHGDNYEVLVHRYFIKDRAVTFELCSAPLTSALPLFGLPWLPPSNAPRQARQSADRCFSLETTGGPTGLDNFSLVVLRNAWPRRRRTKWPLVTSRAPVQGWIRQPDPSRSPTMIKPCSDPSTPAKP